MIIERISADDLIDDGRDVSVSIVDSGFSVVPPYARLYNSGGAYYKEHGDRILAIFTALDEKYPIRNLTLNLACYNPSTGYAGLLKVLRSLPHSDILSMSMLWKDNHAELKNLLQKKADNVFVPMHVSYDCIYPSAYGIFNTCSNSSDKNANYCICPNASWSGNSYAVPAIARIMSYGHGIRESSYGIEVSELFRPCTSGVYYSPVTQNVSAGKMSCPHCHRYMRSTKTNGFCIIDADECPYCGLPL